MLESRLNVLAHQGNDDEDTKNTVDDTGNRSEKIDKELERVGNSCGSELREKNGGADAQRNGNQQRNGSVDDRSVNKWQSAELFEDGVPDGGTEKSEPELVARESGPLPHLENQQHSDENYRRDG